MDIFGLPTTELAQRLLGLELVHETKEGCAGGIITEVEAYLGLQDVASHAYTSNKTLRTKVMHEAPGRLCQYHIRSKNLVLNITSGDKGVPEIVFIRSIVPTIGIDLMLQRREFCVQYGHKNDFSKSKIKNLTNGPGKL